MLLGVALRLLVALPIEMRHVAAVAERVLPGAHTPGAEAEASGAAAAAIVLVDPRPVVVVVAGPGPARRRAAGALLLGGAALGLVGAPAAAAVEARGRAAEGGAAARQARGRAAAGRVRRRVRARRVVVVVLSVQAQHVAVVLGALLLGRQRPVGLGDAHEALRRVRV